MKVKLMSGLLALSLASPLLAQAAPKPISRADFTRTLDTKFNVIDANHDGVITKAELAAELNRELQMARAQLTQKLRQQFQQLDTNKDRQLSFAEFSALVGNLRATQSADQKMQQLDANHDGKISRQEYSAIDLAKFNRADTNRDGVVTPAEARAAAGQR